MSSEVDPLSVDDYLESFNANVMGLGGRVIGEISELKIVQGKYLFFTLKDKAAESALRCFMGWYQYNLSQVEFENGMEIIISGYPKVYKPQGSLSFQTKTAELVGDGQLRKAYEKLKAQLEKEGLFAESKKRPIPQLPQNIGVITSKTGAVIGDLLTNLGPYGFKVQMIDSRVEGQAATEELLTAIRTFRSKKIDVLVIIRGGGSLESFLPFNNEILVREIATFPVPVLVGIGHDKDVPLVALAADRAVSTPSIAAGILTESWKLAVSKMEFDKERIFSTYTKVLTNGEVSVDRSFALIRERLQSIFDGFNLAAQSLKTNLRILSSKISDIERSLHTAPETLTRSAMGLIDDVETRLRGVLGTSLLKLQYGITGTAESTDLQPALRTLENAHTQILSKVSAQEELLKSKDPSNLLKLGYSIVQSGGAVIKKIAQIKEGQKVTIRVQDGSFDSEITKLNN